MNFRDNVNIIRIKSNKTYAAKLATKWTGAIFAVLGFISIFSSLDSILGEEVSMLSRIVFSCILIALVWISCFVGSLIYILQSRKVKVLEVSDGHHVYVQYGNLLDDNEVMEPTKRKNIVIPVNRCFDTLIDDDLISLNTLHGKAMNKLYSDNYFDQRGLDQAIQQDLHKQLIETEPVPFEDKPKGNLERYPVGTVAEVKVSESCTYFFLGLSTFDKNLHAHTSDEEYVLALIRLLQFCNMRSQKYPIVMPLIGAGASDTRKSEKDILKYLIKLMQLNKGLINCDVHIIVRNSGRTGIAIADL